MGESYLCKVVSSVPLVVMRCDAMRCFDVDVSIVLDQKRPPDDERFPR